MEGLSPTFKWVKELQYEFVEKKFNRARIIVYCDGVDKDGLLIYFKDKKITIHGFSEHSSLYRADIKLWFKIKRIKYVFNNGILTIDVKGYRLISFLNL